MKYPPDPRPLWRPWMLSADHGGLRPSEMDDFTPRELEALMRDYEQRGTADG